MLKRIIFGVWLGLASLGYSEHGPEKPSHSQKKREEKTQDVLAVFDLNIFSGEEANGQKSYSACQTSMIAKKRLNPVSSICRVAFLTAAHCVDNFFETIEVVPLGKIEKDCLVKNIPGGYRASAFRRNERKRGDSATLVFEVLCETVENMTPLPLAPFNAEDGATELVGKKVFLQKRRKRESYNAGGGKLIQAEIKSTEGNHFEFEVPSPQGAAILGGDSGGPVFNESGQIICPLSGSSYEGKIDKGALTLPIPDGQSDGPVDPFTVICDRRAISRVKKVLEEHNLTGSELFIEKEAETTTQEPCYKPKAKPKST